MFINIYVRSLHITSYAYRLFNHLFNDDFNQSLEDSHGLLSSWRNKMVTCRTLARGKTELILDEWERHGGHRRCVQYVQLAPPRAAQRNCQRATVGTVPLSPSKTSREFNSFRTDGLHQHFCEIPAPFRPRTSRFKLGRE